MLLYRISQNTYIKDVLWLILSDWPFLFSCQIKDNRYILYFNQYTVNLKTLELYVIIVIVPYIM